jgi:hypothetical protein
MVLEAVTPKGNRTTQVGKFSLDNTQLRLYDPIGRRMFLSVVAGVEGEHLGAGLLVGAAGGAWRFYGGRDLAVDWPLWGPGNSGPVVVGKQKVWLAGKPPRLIDLASGRIQRGPDPRMNWIHAARADGTVFVSRSARHHDGVMVFRPALARPPAGPGGR